MDENSDKQLIEDQYQEEIVTRIFRNIRFIPQLLRNKLDLYSPKLHKTGAFCRGSLRNALVVIVSITALSGTQRAIGADMGDARNFITVATGSTPSPNDPRVFEVQKQLEAIETACSRTSRGAGIHDKLGKGHSLLDAKVPLQVLLADFTRIAAAQCGNMDDSTLIALYVLERNSGRSHSSTVAALRNNPQALAAKWNSR